MSRIKYVIKRSGARVPFTPERISNAISRAAVAVGGRDRTIADDLTRQVVEILEQNPAPDFTPHIEEIQDLVEKVLIENAHARVAKAYILYRDERARRREQQDAQSARSSENIPWPKIWHVLDWALDHGLNTVEGLNARIEAGEFSQVVTESEAAYSVEIENAAPRLAHVTISDTDGSALLLKQGEIEILLPEPQTLLQVGDRLLFCGERHTRNLQALCLFNFNVLSYLLTGQVVPSGKVWRWVERIGKKAPNPSPGSSPGKHA